MKPATQHIPHFPVVRTPPKPGPKSDSDYASSKETEALLSGSLAARNARLEADDMVSTTEAGRLANASRVSINAWIKTGRCIGLEQVKRGFRVPKWQFEPGFWPYVDKLSDALGTNEGWALLAFLETPNGALGGATPRAAIEQGHGKEVLDVAGFDGN